MPAILVEVGFITSQADVKLIQSGKVEGAIANAILDYLGIDVPDTNAGKMEVKTMNYTKLDSVHVIEIAPLKFGIWQGKKG